MVIKKRIEQLIAANKIEAAFREIWLQLEGAEESYKDEFLLLKSRYNQIEFVNKPLKEIIVIKNRIIWSLIDLVGRIPYKKEEVSFFYSGDIPNVPLEYYQRRIEVDIIDEILFSKNSIVGLTGVSGIGKSTLISSICNSRRVKKSKFKGVIWIQEPSQNKLLNLIEIGKNDILNTYGVNLDSKRFITNSPVLIIIDDVKDLDQLSQILDRLGRSKIIFSAKKKVDDSAIVKIFYLNYLSSSEAIENLSSITNFSQEKIFSLIPDTFYEIHFTPLLSSLIGRRLQNSSQREWKAILSNIFKNISFKNKVYNKDLARIITTIKLIVNSLDKNIQYYYKSLLFFPESIVINEKTTKLYWHDLSESESSYLVDFLAQNFLIQLSSDGGVRIHTLHREAIIENVILQDEYANRFLSFLDKLVDNNSVEVLPFLVELDRRRNLYPFNVRSSIRKSIVQIQKNNNQKPYTIDIRAELLLSFVEPLIKECNLSNKLDHIKDFVSKYSFVDLRSSLDSLSLIMNGEMRVFYQHHVEIISTYEKHGHQRSIDLLREKFKNNLCIEHWNTLSIEKAKEWDRGRILNDLLGRNLGYKAAKQLVGLIEFEHDRYSEESQLEDYKRLFKKCLESLRESDKGRLEVLYNEPPAYIEDSLRLLSIKLLYQNEMIDDGSVFYHLEQSFRWSDHPFFGLEDVVEILDVFYQYLKIPLDDMVDYFQSNGRILKNADCYRFFENEFNLALEKHKNENKLNGFEYYFFILKMEIMKRAVSGESIKYLIDNIVNDIMVTISKAEMLKDGRIKILTTKYLKDDLTVHVCNLMIQKALDEDDNELEWKVRAAFQSYLQLSSKSKT